MVSKWDIAPIYPIYKEVISYNPLTNHLLTSWDIQVYILGNYPPQMVPSAGSKLILVKPGFGFESGPNLQPCEMLDLHACVFFWFSGKGQDRHVKETLLKSKIRGLSRKIRGISREIVFPILLLYNGSVKLGVFIYYTHSI